MSDEQADRIAELERRVAELEYELERLKQSTEHYTGTLRVVMDGQAKLADLVKTYGDTVHKFIRPAKGRKPKVSLKVHALEFLEEKTKDPDLVLAEFARSKKVEPDALRSEVSRQRRAQEAKQKASKPSRKSE